MITKKTVLVLGAGASAPYGFPTGGELRRLLIREGVSVALVDKLGFESGAEYEKWQDAVDRSFSPTGVSSLKLKDFRAALKESDQISIDAFLADNEEFVEIGKRLIAQTLLECEYRSVEKLFGNWYQMLFTELVAEGPDFEPGLLSIVTFNYERSLEHYLYRRFFMAYPQRDQDWASEKLRRIKFIHVYGDFGKLQGQNKRSDERFVSYGEPQEWLAAVTGIDLMRRGSEPKYADMIQEHFMSAERIVFLGFGFDSLNLDALGFAELDAIPQDKLSEKYSAVKFASALGLSATRRTHAVNRIGGINFKELADVSFLEAFPIFA